MSMEPRNFPEEKFGGLQGCLVEGDPEQQARQRRVHRRSLLISVLLQVAVLIAVVLLPFFAKTERIALADFTPVPPYKPYHAAPTDPDRPHRPNFPEPCRICFNPNAHPTIDRPSSTPDGDPPDPRFDDSSVAVGVDPNGLNVFDPRARQPRRPDQPPQETNRPHTLRLASIDPAMLRYRVEPVYPALARQIHREGRVEIHAIIGTDGTMQSVQVMIGDPMFYASALAAVQQWIYKPTYLNGQAVQVDTTITVIYSMQH
jgi:TonB family protein